MSKSSGSRELKIGLLVVVGIAAAVWGINYLKGNTFFSNHRTYYSIYPRIDGLEQSNPVILNGYKIGSVREVELLANKEAQLKVTYVIDKDALFVPEDTKANIFSSDLFGSKAIEFRIGESPNEAIPESELVGEVQLDITESLRKELEPLTNRTENLIKTVDSFMANLQSVFEDEGTQGLPKSFESLQRTLATLENTALRLDGMIAENRARFGDIMTNVDSLTVTVSNSRGQLTRTIDNVSNMSDSLAMIEWGTMTADLEATVANLNSITSKIEQGEGSLGLMLNSDSLHIRLTEALREVELLANDLQQNPKRYINFSIKSKTDRDGFSKKELEELRDEIDRSLKK